MLRLPVAALLTLTLIGVCFGQTPQPFPRAGGPGPGSPPTQTVPSASGVPTPETAYFPLYPAAQFIAEYDAGRGQRYLVYGTTAPFTELVAYYRNQLKERGTTVFDGPPTHMFEVGRFRADTMAFPPGVTIKDWTWGGSQGYPNPKPGTEPSRYPTVIVIVPPPPVAAQP